jgi:hypothetical protein
MSLEPSHSQNVSPHSSEFSRSQHADQVLGQMRDSIGDVAQYSSQELYDIISFLKEFCVSLEDEAISKAGGAHQPIHDDLPLF